MQNHDKKGLISLLLGIASLNFFFISWLTAFLPLAFMAIAADIVGLVLSVQARKLNPNAGLGLAGLILCILGLIPNTLLTLLYCSVGCCALWTLSQMLPS